ncbi:MAG TPA: DUF2164 domain-containing protein [Leptospiraceae bacterium]|nr:DUF2164 domain-containing protein [Leptospiraceae bacterium]HMW08272.1 DUF2164 domain-containing protein [Leptospiraceae bacterium]HMX35145.1 DUF2164 domain-containing protein [Leptospiraceae bacterium]HMY34038.1 DUF2164 domain-containing protein [Leptospiraceae bacterium]HMZ67151.1 DUF2164 domain-containing protein [Leptospiraceae bacterium]
MDIELKKNDKDAILASIQKYFREELEIEIGEMQAGFVLKYFLNEIGPFVYNKAIQDAEAFMSDKILDLSAVCYEKGLTYWNKK